MRACVLNWAPRCCALLRVACVRRMRVMHVCAHVCCVVWRASQVESAIETCRAFHMLWRHLGFHPEGFNLASMQVQAGQKGYPLRCSAGLGAEHRPGRSGSGRTTSQL